MLESISVAQYIIRCHGEPFWRASERPIGVDPEARSLGAAVELSLPERIVPGAAVRATGRN